MIKEDLLIKGTGWKEERQQANKQSSKHVERSILIPSASRKIGFLNGRKKEESAAQCVVVSG